MWINKTLLLCTALGGIALTSPMAEAASLEAFKHIVVIYQENHSFDNLYGKWGDVSGQRLDGLSDADLARTVQVQQNGVTPFACLKQLDVNLTSPPLPASCTGNGITPPIVSAFTNQPFQIDDYIGATDKTCPAPGVSATNGLLKDSPGALPGGCTRDMVHRFYSEQFQINQGKQNRYVVGSDAAGLVMGYYDTKKLPIYQYLHAPGAPNYVIADRFFQAAFGGSFLNHQWLIAAATPVFTNAAQDGSANDLHAILDSMGMPTATPLYIPTGPVKDAPLAAKCGTQPATLACGDYAVNTIQPSYWPYSPGTAAAVQLPPLTNPTIGERLSAAGVDWAWYSGGWANAIGDTASPGWTNGDGPTCSAPNADTRVLEGLGFPHCPDKSFQYHHQPFNYFAEYRPGTPARAAHLRDEVEFILAAKNGTLKPVSFVKPLGEENEHPGYASEPSGSQHLVDLIRAVVEGPNGDDTLIIVTYDEFGGSWDHVPPPPYGRDDRENGTDDAQRGDGKGDRGNDDRDRRDKRTYDQWGPGTRVPALIIAKQFRRSGVDHADHDTTSILKLIGERYRLAPLGSRDDAVISLQTALEAGNSGE